MRNWMFIISVFLLAACNEVVYLRNNEKPVLVLYAILEAGCDSMRIELTETKGTYDKSPWQRFPEAEVRVYEEGELLGIAEYQPTDSSFVLRQPVKAEKKYRIEAQVAGKETVWGETHVPKRLEDCQLECWITQQEQHVSYDQEVKCKWKDTPGESNYYWLRVMFASASYSYDWDMDTVCMNWNDTLTWHSAWLSCDSPLPDPFNCIHSDREGEKPVVGYGACMRIDDVGMDGQEMALSCIPEMYGFSSYYVKMWGILMHADRHLDAYQKSAIDWQNNAFPFDGEMTWTLHHVPIYSNVHGGAGLVGSYVPMETVLRLWNLNEAEEGAVFGPGERVK